MKKLAKKIVRAILGNQVRRLYKKNSFKVIAVAGSVGKTSTKLAIASVLSQKFRVRYQEGNYNEIVSVPLIFFNRQLPSLMNPLAWAMIFWRNEMALRKPYPYDWVVVEIGTDAPGQLDSFKKYLKVDLGVLTAITPEHMLHFDDLDAVAYEELAIARLSPKVLVNIDMADKKYLSESNYSSYAIHEPADYRLTRIELQNDVSRFDFTRDGQKIYSAEHFAISEPALYSILAASAAGLEAGMGESEIKQAIQQIKPFAGRMQQLAGINNSRILDDSYNASPAAVESALRTLYAHQSPQKIAVLGNMNELGKFSKKAHQEIGDLCDPKQLEMVVTIGPDANKYLAPAAAAKGCKVHSFDSPYDAGEFLKPIIKKDALILVKGSQNKVFAEEAIKSLLADPADAAKLVRQEEYWMKIKNEAFK